MRRPKAPGDHQLECADEVVLRVDIARICMVMPVSGASMRGCIERAEKAVAAI
jgi:hypothetical protein